MTTPGQPPVVQALQRVLAAQHAAVYAYPVIGVALRDAGQVDRARQLESQHRDTRDAVVAQLTGRGVTPVPAEASYAPPQPVTGPADAQRWALELEQACAGAYRYLLVAPVLGTAKPSAGAAGGSAAGGPDGTAPDVADAAVRKQALTGLNAAARDATGWRTLLSPTAPTVPFPGL